MPRCAYLGLPGLFSGIKTPYAGWRPFSFWTRWFDEPSSRAFSGVPFSVIFSWFEFFAYLALSEIHQPDARGALPFSFFEADRSPPAPPPPGKDSGPRLAHYGRHKPTILAAPPKERHPEGQAFPFDIHVMSQRRSRCWKGRRWNSPRKRAFRATDTGYVGSDFGQELGFSCDDRMSFP